MNNQTHEFTIKEETGGSICGGCISESMFKSDPMAYMMVYVMPDKQYAKYITIKDAKKQKQFFDRYARSAI